MVEGLSGSTDGSIDIFFSYLLDCGQNRLVVGVDDVEGVAFDGVDETAIDEELLDES